MIIPDRDERVIAYISKTAIIHNLNEIKRTAGRSTKLMAVVKADGYGHKVDFIVQIMGCAVDYYAVATVEEAVEIRKLVREKPILVLGCVFPEMYYTAVEQDITVSISTIEDAVKLSEIAAQFGKTAKVHIKVDTGMGRIGFRPDEKSADIVAEIAKLDNIEVEGVFTHFATSDEADFSFTQLQAERFISFRKMLEERKLLIKLYHAANSGAIMQHMDYKFNMVRAGIILYGLYPSDEVDRNSLNLMPVMKIHSRVAFVKTINKGDSISYGRTFVAEKEMRIATIPVGYADGYPRLLSNKGRVIINGKYAPIVGRICMDQFMVDVSDVENVEVGTKVILMGSDGECSVTADEIAALTGTINYEVVCSINKRVPREVVE